MTRKADKVIINLEKFQIAQTPDKKTFIIREWVEGGMIPGTQEKGQDKWIDVSYYGQLKHLIESLILRNFESPEGTLQTQLKDILVELRRVEKSLLEEMQKQLKSDF